MSNLNFHDVSEEERKLYAAFNNLIAFGKLFLPGDFFKTRPTPEHHYEMGEQLLSPSNKPCAFLLARDSAKTTLTKAKILHDFCFAEKAVEWGFRKEIERLFYGWVADSQRKSIKNVLYIKVNIEYNPIMKYFFGDLRGDVWNQEEVTTSNGCRLISSSNMTSMRGDTMATIEEGAVRYSSVFVDDCCNEQNTITETSRAKIIDNIMNGILPAIDNTKPGRRLFYSGTPVHFDDFTQNILDKWIEAVAKEGGKTPLYWTTDKEELMAREKARESFPWHVIAYRSTQPELPGGVLWNAYKSREKLDEIKSRYAIRGDLAGYYQEYELEVQHEEDALYGRKALNYHTGVYEHEQGVNYLTLKGFRKVVNTFIGCDPATDIKTKRSDFSVIIVIAVDRDNNVYVLHYERHRSIQTVGNKDVDGNLIGEKGVVDYIIELHQKFHCESSTVEDVAMTRSVFQALNMERRRLNKFNIVVKPYQPATKEEKLSRIYSELNGRFASGAIYIRENHYELIDEIIKFGPKMAHDDAIDALHMACINAYPPVNYQLDKKTNQYRKRIRTPNSWKTGRPERPVNKQEYYLEI